jgi:hypothetical protein
VFSHALAGSQTPDNVMTRELMAGMSTLLSQLGWPVEMHPIVALQMLGTSLYAQANMLAFRDVFLFLGLVYFVAMVPAMLLRIPKGATVVPGAPARRGGGGAKAVSGAHE